MPRPLRIHYPNATYHVMNRGAGRRIIFKNKSHRAMFLELLDESRKMFNVKIYAYCLMDNHYHLLISTPDANLSRVMRHINGVYTQKFNRTENTDGPLFRGRYKAQLIEDDCYQLIVSRYIHLNPVDARMTRQPADYIWSSYRAYLGIIKSPEWLSTDIILNLLSETKSLSHVANYQDYVENKSIEEINTFTGRKLTTPILGSEVFKEKILSTIDEKIAIACSPDIKLLRRIPEIEFIIKQVCAFYHIDRNSLIPSKPNKTNWPKLVCIYICRKWHGYSLREIRRYVNFHRSESVSTAVRKCQSKLIKYPELLIEVNNIVAIIKNNMSEQDDL